MPMRWAKGFSCVEIPISRSRSPGRVIVGERAGVDPVTGYRDVATIRSTDEYRGLSAPWPRAPAEMTDGRGSP